MTATQDKIIGSSETQIPTPKRKVAIGVFGEGRFSAAMHELFKDVQRLFKFTPVQAHVSAAQWGIDAGGVFKGNAVSVKHGDKLNKNGQITLKETSDAVKNVNLTWALAIGCVVQQVDKTRKFGLVVKDITMSPQVMDFVNEHASRIEPAE